MPNFSRVLRAPTHTEDEPPISPLDRPPKSGNTTTDVSTNAQAIGRYAQQGTAFQVRFTNPWQPVDPSAQDQAVKTEVEMIASFPLPPSRYGSNASLVGSSDGASMRSYYTEARSSHSTAEGDYAKPRQTSSTTTAGLAQRSESWSTNRDCANQSQDNQIGFVRSDPSSVARTGSTGAAQRTVYAVMPPARSRSDLAQLSPAFTREE